MVDIFFNTEKSVHATLNSKQYTSYNTLRVQMIPQKVITIYLTKYFGTNKSPY